MGDKATQRNKDQITQSLVSQKESDPGANGECLKNCVKLRNMNMGKNGGREIGQGCCKDSGKRIQQLELRHGHGDGSLLIDIDSISNVLPRSKSRFPNNMNLTLCLEDKQMSVFSPGSISFSPILSLISPYPTLSPSLSVMSSWVISEREDSWHFSALFYYS